MHFKGMLKTITKLTLVLGLGLVLVGCRAPKRPAFAAGSSFEDTTPPPTDGGGTGGNDTDVYPTSGKRVYVRAVASTNCGNAQGSGTEFDPYDSLYWAMTNPKSNLQCGDVLVLRGGTYRIRRDLAFFPTQNENDRLNNCSDKESDNSYSGDATVLPILSKFNCPDTTPLAITNYKGEEVVLDGTDQRMETRNNWEQCTSNGCCGSGPLPLANPSKHYCSTKFNVANTNTPQIWVNPTNSSPGTRIRWAATNPYLVRINSDRCHIVNCDSNGNPTGSGEIRDLNPGTFYSVSLPNNGGSRVVIRMANDGDPDNSDVKLNCQMGSCARNVISVSGKARNVHVLKNPGGGAFRVKYGYYPVFVTGNQNGVPSKIGFDSLDIMAAGGNDYGQCIRVHNGTNISINGVSCREAMAEGIAIYGGDDNNGINISGNSVQNSTVNNTGLAWLDGGGKGGSLGQGIILKNCSNCAARGNTVSKTFRGGIQVNLSASCYGGNCQSNNVSIENNVVSDNCRVRDENSTTFPQNTNGGIDYCGAIHAFINDNDKSGSISNLAIKSNTISKNYSWTNSNNAAPAGVRIDGNRVSGQLFKNSINGFTTNRIVTPGSGSVGITE